MRSKFFSFAVLLVLASTVASYFPDFHTLSPETPYIEGSGTSLQTEKKPPQDFMKKFLSRNTTKPLGLKEDKALNKLLEQPNIKWVIRSEIKHILN